MGCSVRSLRTVEEVQNPASQVEAGSHRAAGNLQRPGREAAVDILPVEEGNLAGLHSSLGLDHLATVSIKNTLIMLPGSTLGLPFQLYNNYYI